MADKYTNNKVKEDFSVDCVIKKIGKDGKVLEENKLQGYEGVIFLGFKENGHDITGLGLLSNKQAATAMTESYVEVAGIDKLHILAGEIIVKKNGRYGCR